jgi:hypothetical protein
MCSFDESGSGDSKNIGFGSDWCSRKKVMIVKFSTFFLVFLRDWGDEILFYLSRLMQFKLRLKITAEKFNLDSKWVSFEHFLKKWFSISNLYDFFEKTFFSKKHVLRGF